MMGIGFTLSDVVCTHTYTLSFVEGNLTEVNSQCEVQESQS